MPEHVGMEGEIARPAALTRCRVSTLVYLPPVPSSSCPWVAAFVCPFCNFKLLSRKRKKKALAFFLVSAIYQRLSLSPRGFPLS
jgi:hypothetical protein